MGVVGSGLVAPACWTHLDRALGNAVDVDRVSSLDPVERGSWHPNRSALLVRFCMLERRVTRREGEVEAHGTSTPWTVRGGSSSSTWADRVRAVTCVSPRQDRVT